MILEKFLADVKMFQSMNTSDNVVWDSCQILIDKVKAEIEEIKQDHLQGDADDASHE